VSEAFDYKEWDDKLGEELPVMEDVFEYGQLLLLKYEFTESKICLIAEDLDDEIDIYKARELLISLYEECEAGIRVAPELVTKQLREPNSAKNFKPYVCKPYDYKYEEDSSRVYFMNENSLLRRGLKVIERWSIRIVNSMKGVRF